MDARDGHLEELCACVSEHAAGGRVGGDEAIAERVEDEGSVCHLLDEELEVRVLARHAAARRTLRRAYACSTPST